MELVVFSSRQCRVRHSVTTCCKNGTKNTKNKNLLFHGNLNQMKVKKVLEQLMKAKTNTRGRSRTGDLSRVKAAS